MTNRRYWTKKEYAKIRTYIGDNYPYGKRLEKQLEELSLILGRTKESIRKKILKLDIKREIRQRIVRYYYNNTRHNTAKKFGVSVGTVEKIVNGVDPRPKLSQYNYKKAILLIRHYYLVSDDKMIFFLNTKIKNFYQSKVAEVLFGCSIRFMVGLSYADHFDIFGKMNETNIRTKITNGSKKRPLFLVPWVCIDDKFGEISEHLNKLKKVQRIVFNTNKDEEIRDILYKMQNDTLYMGNIPHHIDLNRLKGLVKSCKESYNEIIKFRDKRVGGKIDPNRSLYLKYFLDL